MFEPIKRAGANIAVDDTETRGDGAAPHG